jgi:hypothetical protein
MSQATKDNRINATLYYYRNREKILERLNTAKAKEKRATYFSNYYTKNREEINRKRREKKRDEYHKHYYKKHTEIKQDEIINDLIKRKTPFLVSFN